MQLDLSKGMSLDLTKTGDTKFKFDLSWDPADVGEDVDVDASAFMIDNVNGTLKLIDLSRVAFFNQKVTPCGALTLSGDSKDGSSEGVDEFISIDTSKIPATVEQINLYVNIFKPAITFSKIKNVKAVVSSASGTALAQFNVTNDFQEENSILVGAIKKSNGNWSFTAEGEGYVISDLNTIVSHLAGGL